LQGLKKYAQQERLKLIDQIDNKIKKFDPLDLLSILGTNFFGFPEDFAKSQHEVTQVCNEFVAGLLSSKPRTKRSLPTPEDTKDIAELFQKLIFTYFYENLPINKQPKTYSFQSMEEARLAYFTLSYFMIVRGEGYPEQLWNAAIEIYSPHNEYLKKHFGFTIEQVMDIFKWLYRAIEIKFNNHAVEFKKIFAPSMAVWQDWHDGKIDYEMMLSKVNKIDKDALVKQLADHNKRTKDIFTFTFQEIADTFGTQLAQAFLKRFASNFGEINNCYREPADFNELNRIPLLKTNEKKVFIPIPLLLYQVPVVTLHYDLIQDPDYSESYSKARGDYLERKASVLMGTIFGAFSYHTNLRFVNLNKEEGEIDLLVKFDNKLVFVECKSKGLTLPAKQGNLKQIRKDFANAIQRAYDQNQKAINYINESELSKFYEHSGKEIILEKEKISDVYSIILTANTFSSLTTDLSIFLKKDKASHYPWAICESDLELVAEYLHDPYSFIQFLKRRREIYGRVISPDEMDYVGCYLKDGLYFEKELKKANEIVLVGYTEQFDAAELKRIGKLRTAQVGSTWSNPAFENLLGTIKLLNGYGHSDIILLLLELDSQSRDNLIRLIKQTIEKTFQDKKSHDFTMLFDSGNFGISFVSETKRSNLARKVEAIGSLKKYKYKSKTWLSLGRDVSDKSYLVNEYAILQWDWKFDPILDQESKRLQGTVLDITNQRSKVPDEIT
jgi:hypothetical protein